MARRTRSGLPPLGTDGATARQLILLVVAIAVVTAFSPVVANALGSLVTIQDSSTTRDARVDRTAGFGSATAAAP